MSTKTFNFTLKDRGASFAEPGAWSRTLLLCFAPRTGSNLLARHMWRTGALGSPQEFFNYDVGMFNWATKLGANNLTEYVQKTIAAHTSPNGVFAAKLLPGHWQMLQMSLSAHLLGNADIVLITRRDIVAQAVSQSIAAQSGAWTSETNVKSDAVVAYDYNQILGTLRYLEGVYAFWSGTLARRPTPVLLMTYENFHDRAEAAVQRIASFFRIELPPASVLPHVQIVEKQATERNSDWADRFRAEMKARGDALSPSPFAAQYLQAATAQPGATPNPALRNSGFPG